MHVQGRCDLDFFTNSKHSTPDAHLVLVWRLCATNECVLVTLCGNDNRAVGLEVKVLLAAQLDGALQHVVGSCDRVPVDRNVAK